MPSWADDTAVSKAVNTMDNVDLQNDPKKIYKWAEANRMTFSKQKFVIGADEFLKEYTVLLSCKKKKRFGLHVNAATIKT